MREFWPIRRLNRGSLEHPKVRIHHQDAFTFIRDTNEKFDRIVIDLPDPRIESFSKLYSVELYKSLKQHLGKNGALTTQSSSPFFTRKALWCVAETMKKVGFRTHSF